MHVQEQAFRAYYGSMTDGDLLAVAANRTSFIPLAQQLLCEEVARRNLALPAGSAPPEKVHSASALSTVVHRLLPLRRYHVHN